MGRRDWADAVPLLWKSVVHFQTFGTELAECWPTQSESISVDLLVSECL